MTVIKYQGKKFAKGNFTNVNDNLTVEQPLKISINSTTFTITMRTPGDDADLVRGLLFSEDIYRNEQILDFTRSENQKKNITEVNVFIEKDKIGKGYLNSRNLMSVSSCGICGKTELEDIDCSQYLHNETRLPLNEFFKMFERMNAKQVTFYQSGGSHAAAAFSTDSELLSIKEDIGRHNAVDKVIGALLNKQELQKAKVLTVSGRISYEIIIKAFAAKIPILAAVSAPSSLAVDFAKELGITLLGFCRENKVTCYSHPERIY